MIWRRSSNCKNCVVPAQRSSCSGLTLFEFVVVVVILSILLGVLLERIVFYQHAAEEAAVQKQITNLRSALNGRVLQARLAGKPQQIRELHNLNPVELLVSQPINYGGEVGNSAAVKLTGGNFYFDVSERNLIYVFRSKKSFPEDLYQRWYFKVESSCLPTKDAKPGGAPTIECGVALIQVDG